MVISLTPAASYMFKVTNRNTTTRCEIYSSKLTIKTPKQCHWLRSGVFIVNLFHTLFLCFYCKLWAGKCRLGCIFISFLNLNITVSKYNTNWRQTAKHILYIIKLFRKTLSQFLSFTEFGDPELRKKFNLHSSK